MTRWLAERNLRVTSRNRLSWKRAAKLMSRIGERQTALLRQTALPSSRDAVSFDVPAAGFVYEMNLEKQFQDALYAFQAGDLRRAEKLLRKIDRAAPDQQPVLHLRGMVALRDDRPGQAVQYLKRAVAMQPSPDLLLALGSAYGRAGAVEDAIAVLSGVLETSPGNADAAYNLANVLKNAGRYEDALPYYEAAVRADPDFADAYYNMGLALGALCRFSDAAGAYSKSLEIDPHDAEATKNLANALYNGGDGVAARPHLERAVALDPNNADAQFNLANLLHAAGEMDASFAAYENALRLNPGEPAYINNFALLLKDLGEIDAAIEQLRALRRGTGIPPAAHSNLLFCMMNSPEYGPAEQRAEAEAWNKLHCAPLRREWHPHDNAPEPGRRIRVGYMSGDLRQHPVGFFMEPVFAHHDKAKFEVQVFASQNKRDSVTERIAGHADRWHDIGHLDIHPLAEAIRAAGIDVLVDLSGHAAHNRLITLALKPAPVQLLGGGLFCTSGLDCVNGLLSDRLQSPEESNADYTEPVIRLPDDYVCYRPPDYAPSVTPSPVLENGYVTFGCFNNLSKISTLAVSLWADVLKAIPGSRLLLKTTALESARARMRLTALFAAHGVGEERIVLEKGLPHEAFLAAYSRVDIALDPLPYSGGLTTLEALWMGVPVITLPGRTLCSRHSLSHLGNAGLTDLICGDTEDYVAKAVALAADPVALDGLRQSIRQKLAGSPILNGERYARNLERVYLECWQAWCARQ